MRQGLAECVCIYIHTHLFVYVCMCVYIYIKLYLFLTSRDRIFSECTCGFLLMLASEFRRNRQRDPVGIY